MKKELSFWFLTLLLVMSVSFSSCKKDDPGGGNEGNSNPENLVGSWSYLKGGSISLSDYHIGYGYSERSSITFKKDGTYEAWDANAYNDWDYYGTWSVKGNTLTALLSYYLFNDVRKDGGATFVRTFSINGNTLKLSGDSYMNPDGALDVYYTRDSE